MINISRATVERQTRSYFAPPSPGKIVFYAKDLPRVKMPDDIRVKLQSDAAFQAIGDKRHQEYLAQHWPSQESLYTQYGKLTTDAERETFIQKQVDETMAAYEAINEHERQQQEIANRDMSVSSADQSNASVQSAAISMYQSVQNAGDSATTSGQGTGVAA